MCAIVVGCMLRNSCDLRLLSIGMLLGWLDSRVVLDITNNSPRALSVARTICGSTKADECPLSSKRWWNSLSSLLISCWCEQS